MSEFHDAWNVLYENIGTIRADKESAYTDGTDPLQNYSITASIMCKTVERQMLSRMCEKFVRLLKTLPLTQEECLPEEVARNILENEIPDIANISLLIGASLITKAQNPVQLSLPGFEEECVAVADLEPLH